MKRAMVLLSSMALLLTWGVFTAGAAGAAAAVAPVPAVYSVDVAKGALVSVPAAGGRPKVLVSGADIKGLAADAAGNVYYADATAMKVVKVAAGTGAVTTLASNLRTTRDIAVDSAGNVHFADGNKAYKVTPAGKRSTSYTAAADIVDLAVTPSGRLTLAYPSAGVFGVTLVTVTATGGVSSRELDCSQFGYCSELKVDSRGALWVLINASGASGYSEWHRVATTARTPSDLIKTRIGYYGVGLDGADTFYVAATKTFCTSIGQNTGGCTPDRRSTEILRITANGTFTSTLPVSGLTLSSQSSEIDVDSAGSIFITAENGLLKYAKAGGAPVVFAAGNYDQVVVVG
jgi:hypothetical protein